MNNRLEQLNAAYKKALGAVFIKEFEHFTPLTIVDVLIDPSTQTGRVWLSTTPEILETVNKRRGEIQKELTKHINTRYTPKLQFLLDDKYLDRMDEIFQNLDKDKHES